jgi:hypothetical protein
MSHFDAKVFYSLYSTAFFCGVKQFCAAHTNAPQREMRPDFELLLRNNGL